MTDTYIDDATLAEHSKLVHGVMDGDLFNHSYNFTVLQLSPQDLDACEQRWVNRLTILVPFDLNKEAPNGVSSSITSRCRKSLTQRNSRQNSPNQVLTPRAAAAT